MSVHLYSMYVCMYLGVVLYGYAPYSNCMYPYQTLASYVNRKKMQVKLSSSGRTYRAWNSVRSSKNTFDRSEGLKNCIDIGNQNVVVASSSLNIISMHDALLHFHRSHKPNRMPKRQIWASSMATAWSHKSSRWANWLRNLITQSLGNKR